MPRKAKIAFSVFLMAIVLAGPVTALAWDVYSVSFCPWSEEENFGPKVKVLDTHNCVTTTVCYEGLVPCGKLLPKITGTDPKDCAASQDLQLVHCTFCHIFLMANSIIAFVLLKLVPPVTVLMIVIGGVMFFLGGAKPDLIQRGKKLIQGVLIGIFLVYGAYFIVGEVLTVVGISKHNPLSQVFQKGIFSIQCPIQVPCKSADSSSSTGCPNNGGANNADNTGNTGGTGGSNNNGTGGDNEPSPNTPWDNPDQIMF
ncbi:MAG: pilin [Candidatus Pacebacteria bacterium]|nr:pilin [Candidatus Paceibacterota bacterium]